MNGPENHLTADFSNDGGAFSPSPLNRSTIQEALARHIDALFEDFKTLTEKGEALTNVDGELKLELFEIGNLSGLREELYYQLAALLVDRIRFNQQTIERSFTRIPTTITENLWIAFSVLIHGVEGEGEYTLGEMLELELSQRQQTPEQRADLQLAYLLISNAKREDLDQVTIHPIFEALIASSVARVAQSIADYRHDCEFGVVSDFTLYFLTEVKTSFPFVDIVLRNDEYEELAEELLVSLLIGNEEEVVTGTCMLIDYLSDKPTRVDAVLKRIQNELHEPSTERLYNIASALGSIFGVVNEDRSDKLHDEDDYILVQGPPRPRNSKPLEESLSNFVSHTIENYFCSDYLEERLRGVIFFGAAYCSMDLDSLDPSRVCDPTDINQLKKLETFLKKNPSAVDVLIGAGFLDFIAPDIEHQASFKIRTRIVDRLCKHQGYQALEVSLFAADSVDSTSVDVSFEKALGVIVGKLNEAKTRTMEYGDLSAALILRMKGALHKFLVFTTRRRDHEGNDQKLPLAGEKRLLEWWGKIVLAILTINPEIRSTKSVFDHATELADKLDALDQRYKKAGSSLQEMIPELAAVADISRTIITSTSSPELGSETDGGDHQGKGPVDTVSDQLETNRFSPSD